MVEASTSTLADFGSIPAFPVDFFPGRHTSDLNMGTAVAALPDTWHCKVSAGPGQPGVGIL